MEVTAGLLQEVQVRVTSVITEAILPIIIVQGALYHVPAVVRNIRFLQGAAEKAAISHQVHIAGHLHLHLQVIQVHQDLSQGLIQAEDLHHTHQVHLHSRQGHLQVVVLTVHQVVHRREEGKLITSIVY